MPCAAVVSRRPSAAPPVAFADAGEPETRLRAVLTAKTAQRKFQGSGCVGEGLIGESRTHPLPSSNHAAWDQRKDIPHERSSISNTLQCFVKFRIELACLPQCFSARATF
jgi:hypothetical protein